MAPLDPIAALHAGTCSDPFALLGPHSGTVDGQPALVVRFFHPDAEEVDLLTPVAAGPVRMTRNAGTDLFRGRRSRVDAVSRSRWTTGCASGGRTAGRARSTTRTGSGGS